MLRNRLIFSFLILAAGVFSSFYGGTSYLLLFALLLLLLVSFLYLVFVFISLKISQSVEERVLYKGEETSYRFVLRNKRGFLVCTRVELRFKTGLFEADGLEPLQHYSLPPGGRIDQSARIRCLYRGTYPVGVESIAATDFLGLFRLKRTVRSSQTTIQVLPRVIRLSRLAAAPDDEDAKTLPFSAARTQEQPDVESRPYTAGDGLKTVNWKLSARQQELLVRKYIDQSKIKVLVAVDLAEIEQKDPLERIVIEDKIIEASLAVVDYFFRRRVPLEALYSTADPQQINFKLDSQIAFDQLYQIFSGISFSGSAGFSSLLERAAGSSEKAFCVAVTHRLDEALCRAANHFLSLNAGLCVIQINAESSQEIPRELDRRIRLVRISKEEELSSVLETIRGEWE